MKYVVLLLALSAWILSSCGESTSSTAAQENTKQGPVNKPEEKGSEKETVKSPQDKNVLKGEVAPEGGTQTPGKLTLVSRPDNKIEGSFKIEGTEYMAQGMNESGDIRLWVSEKNTDNDNIKRGVMLGNPKDGAYIGTFSVSGNGGEPLVKGTWKTNGVF